jgi:hydroxymethylbilane synthase
MSKALTVATRGGALAIAQTEIVTGSLTKMHPDMQIKTRKVATKGDRDRHTVLWNLKDTGFFTSQVEDALLAGEADFAVHSFKDLPTRQREGLTIAAVRDRQFVQDCLVAATPISSAEQLRSAARIGTSSLRRAAQVRRLRNDLQPTPIRGNVRTRIRRLRAGEVDAIILARAGMERLGLTEQISYCFDPKQFIPAPAQGALAVQTRSDDIATTKLIAALNDSSARATAFAERQVLVTMQCGCHAPVGAFAEMTGDNITIRAFISDLQGEEFLVREVTGPASRAGDLAERLANELLEAGGREILDELETNKDS